MNSLAEVGRVEWLHVARDEHHVVCGLVVYNKLAVAVVHKAARGEYRLLEEGIGIGRLLVALIVELQVEEPDGIYESDDKDKTADYIFAFFEFIIFSHVVGR